MNRIFEKIKQNGYAFDGKFPHSQMNGEGKYVLTDGGHWTDGFYVGVFNIAYILSGDEEFRTLAKAYDAFFALRIQNTEAVNKENNFRSFT